MSELPWEGHIPDQPARLLVVGSVLVLGFGFVNRFLKEKLYLGEPLIATVLGSILGPHAIKLLDCEDPCVQATSATSSLQVRVFKSFPRTGTKERKTRRRLMRFW